MADRVKNILVTGSPGVGKTTLLRTVASRLRERQPALILRGFTTDEFRDAHGERLGFVIRTVAEPHNEVVMSRVGSSKPKVGKYSVDVDTIDRVAVTELRAERCDVLVLDEIGKMECLSATFCNAARDVLNAPHTVIIGSVARNGGGFIAEAKGRADVDVVQATRANRDSLVETLLGRVLELTK